MKHSTITIAIILSFFFIALNSCKKDEDNSTSDTEISGNYNLIMNGNTVAEGTSTNKVALYGTTVNLGGAGSELVITITNVPVSVGGTIEIDQSSGTNGDHCQITISGNNLIKNGADEIYWGISGTVTRTSATKISFTGVCKEDASATITHTFEGYVESNAYEVK